MELTPELTLELTPELTLELTPELTLELTPELTMDSQLLYFILDSFRNQLHRSIPRN